MKKKFILLVFVIFFINANEDRPLKMLIEGNLQFLKTTTLQSSREKGLEGQSPFAVILACADSRVSPELIFDTALGEIFVIRNAGNVVDDVTIASIEFAVDVLKTSLIIVIGHQYCNAVQGTLDVTFENWKADPESLNTIFRKIQPSFKGVDSVSELKKATENNAIYQKNQLIKKSSIIRSKVREGKVKCLSMYYDISSGRVSEIKK